MMRTPDLTPEEDYDALVSRAMYGEDDEEVDTLFPVGRRRYRLDETAYDDFDEAEVRGSRLRRLLFILITLLLLAAFMAAELAPILMSDGGAAPPPVRPIPTPMPLI